MAARFYAQARPEVAEKASREHTVGDQVGTKAGTVGGENGARQCPSEDSADVQELPQSVDNQPVMMVDEGQCELLNNDENGRRGTRTIAFGNGKNGLVDTHCPANCPN